MNNRVYMLLIVFVLFIPAGQICASEHQVESPNGKLLLNVTIEKELTWSVSFNGVKLLKDSPISMKLQDQTIPLKNYALINKEVTETDEIIETIVAQKSKKVRNYYNELRLDFIGNYSVLFRAYNNGCAYRFETSFNDDIKVYDEKVSFNFAGDYKIYFPEEESFISHYERKYLYEEIDNISSKRFASLPALVDAEKGIKIGITESALYDYPCMFLEGTGEKSLKGIFPKHVLEVKDSGDRSERITKEAGYIAETKGSRSFPWRVLMISENDKELVENQLVFLLSDPLKLNDTDWIKPGKVAWDWWNALNIFGVDFKSGINTETYKYYIDFASKFNIQYIILDEGWSKSTTDIAEPNPDIDIEELINYGKEKNVGIILWVLWKPLDKNIEEVLDKYVEWGAKGVKVDFMQRADQWMVNYYEKVCRETANRKLLVDFHGAFKPAGLMRPYPNYLTCEGVKGLENNKWSDEITPEHDVTLPFTRMLAGPMDYTPGAMVNARTENFRALFDRPMSQGTRAHQAAMYVVYESPLQMLCDSPSRYLRDENYTSFISKFPVTWDTTIVLDAIVADYIIVAREKDNVWYIGGLNDNTPRNISIDLSFLGDGNYNAEILQDGINANSFAEDYKLFTKEITEEDKVEINFAAGGGWAAIIQKK